VQILSAELHPHHLVPVSQPVSMLLQKPQQLMKQLSKPPMQRLLLRQQLPHRVQAAANGWFSPSLSQRRLRLRQRQQRLPAVR
jgi:hypothetical protein